MVENINQNDKQVSETYMSLGGICARWSHPILAFITFHEIDFATNVPSVLFTRNSFES